jgi:dihydroorotate dehydrogenase
MYPIFRQLLFRVNPEHVHALTLHLMKLAGDFSPFGSLLRRWYVVPPKPVQVFGVTFPNALGLAAGYDKDGLAWRGLACLGFGHIEVGTVTPRPQPGNPKPRLFRLPKQGALINRMGFPGMGAEYVSRNLQRSRPPGLKLGVNLGKNRDTPLEQAAVDYRYLMQVFAPQSDFLVINISSPNTVGLRRLQARQALDEFLAQIVDKRHWLEIEIGKRTPLLVKLSPDMTDSELDDALDVISRSGVDGVVATNTTVDREGLNSPLAVQTGGLSGAPLRERSTAIIRQIVKTTGGKLPVVGVGGIMNLDDAQEKLDAGASLVQIYTGMVFRGPGLVKEILRGC